MNMIAADRAALAAMGNTDPETVMTDANREPHRFWQHPAATPNSDCTRLQFAESTGKPNDGIDWQPVAEIPATAQHLYTQAGTRYFGRL